MQEDEIYIADAIVVDNRSIYPIMSLKTSLYFNKIINVTQQPVAIKVVEGDETYYLNISMDEDEFIKLKKE